MEKFPGDTTIYAQPSSTSPTSGLQGATLTGIRTTGSNSSASSSSTSLVDAHDRSRFTTTAVDGNSSQDGAAPLIIRAASIGKTVIINRLIANGAQINAVSIQTGRTALCEALLRGHDDAGETLVKCGCSLDDTDGAGFAALHYACMNGKLPMIKLLLQRRANPNIRDSTQQTALHIAATKGDYLTCSTLLDHGAQIGNRDAESKTALQVACANGHFEVVEMLLTRTKLKPSDLSFITAFFAAVESGHVRIVQYLIQMGMKPKKLKKESYKPITLAAKSGNLDMVNLMIQEKCTVKDKDENEWNALHFAAHYGQAQVAKRLIAKGLSVKAATVAKETPLIVAAKGGHFAVAEVLLRHKASVKAEDTRSQQAIHHAVRSGSLDILNLLIKHGAKVDTENVLGWTPIHIAAAYGYELLAMRLLEEGAPIDEKLGATSVKRDQTHKMIEDGCWAEAQWPHPGSRPLHLACEFGHHAAVQTLIAKGAKVDAKCSENWRPLHLAAFNAMPETVALLIGSGAEVHALTGAGKTPVELGFRSRGALIPEDDKSRVLNMLREAGERAPRPRTFKIPGMRKGKTAEDKNDTIRAVTTSRDLIANTRASLQTRSTSGLNSLPPPTAVQGLAPVSIKLENSDTAPSVALSATTRINDTTSSARVPTKAKIQNPAVGPPPPYALAATRERQEAPIASTSFDNNIAELGASDLLQNSNISELSGGPIHELANGGASPARYIAYNLRR